MNRRLNGFIKKPHIFVDKLGKWVLNIGIGCSYADEINARYFCHERNLEEYRNG